MAVNMQDLIDIDLLAYFKSKLDLIFNTKVDKVAGKGLSTNDFTAGYKNKLDNIENNAQENDIETVKIDGTLLTITNKAVDIPLASTTQAGLLSPAQKIKLDGMDSLPTGGSNGQIYVKGANGIVWDDPKNFEWYTITINAQGNATMSSAIDLEQLEAAITLKKLPIFRAYCNRSIIGDTDDKYVYIPMVARRYQTTTADYVFSTVYNNYALMIYLSYTDSGNTFRFSFAREKLAKDSDLEGKFQFYNATLIPTANQGLYSVSGFTENLDSLYDRALDKKLQYLVLDEHIFASLQAVDTDISQETLEPYAENVHFYGFDGISLYHVFYDYGGWYCMATDIATSDDVNDLYSALALKANSSSVYTKTEIDQMLVGTFNYKGTKATVGDLPVSGNMTGDVWNVLADGSDWAWNGSAWEELGTTIDLSGYVQDTDIGLATNQDIDNMFTPYDAEP